MTPPSDLLFAALLRCLKRIPELLKFYFKLAHNLTGSLVEFPYLLSLYLILIELTSLLMTLTLSSPVLFPVFSFLL